MAGAFASDTAKVGRARRARSMNSRTASYCDRAGTATIVSGRWRRKRTNPPRDLTRDAERLTGRRQHPDRVVVRQRAAVERGARLHEVLAVVEHEERRRPPAGWR